MICDYCRTTNSETDHRCRRCQRRLGSFATMASASKSSYPVSRQATAVAYQPDYEPVAKVQAAKAPVFESIKGDRPAGSPSTPAHQEAMQSVMFAIRNATKIVSIDGSSDATQKTAAAAKVTATKTRTSSPPAPAFHQGVLDIFNQPNNDFRQVKSEVRRQIYCEDRVCSIQHRAAAAAVDFSFIVLSMALFAFPFVYGGGEVSLDNPLNKIMFGALFVIIPLLYKLFWAFAGADSPGAVIVGLRLTDFDGRRPGRAVRIHRVVWSGVSTFSAFLGVAWILFDEESLSWHDHITRTFLTAERVKAGRAANTGRLVDAWVN